MWPVLHGWLQLGSKTPGWQETPGVLGRGERPTHCCQSHCGNSYLFGGLKKSPKLLLPWCGQLTQGRVHATAPLPLLLRRSIPAYIHVEWKLFISIEFLKGTRRGNFQMIQCKPSFSNELSMSQQIFSFTSIGLLNVHKVKYVFKSSGLHENMRDHFRTRPMRYLD